MSVKQSVTDRLRSAFAADVMSRAPGESCPEPDRVWEAVAASLEVRQRREIVEHVSRCAACAADWRLAMRAEQDGLTLAQPGRRARWPYLAAAAALLVVVGSVAVLQWRPDKSMPPVYRADEQIEIHSLMPVDEPVPRERCVLNWSPVGERARYRIEVDTQGLEPLAAAQNLDEPRFVVPPQALEKLASGEVIVWRVEAALSDGRHIESRAFLTRIE